VSEQQLTNGQTQSLQPSQSSQPSEEATKLLEKISPGEWTVEDETPELLDEYIPRVRREGCCCGTNDPSDPWCEGHEPEYRVFSVEGPKRILVADYGYYLNEADATFIAAAPRLIRALQAQLLTVEQASRELKDSVRYWQDAHTFTKEQLEAFKQDARDKGREIELLDEMPDLLEMSHALRGLGDALAFDPATAPEAMRLEVLRIARETVEWAVAQFQPLHSMQEAAMWKWANEQLAIAKTPQVTNERPISAEEWPCTFSHHTHATREEAVECARPRREGASPAVTPSKEEAK
jgi:hypothetical protein